jgi:hypothetical protein
MKLSRLLKNEILETRNGFAILDLGREGGYMGTEREQALAYRGELAPWVVSAWWKRVTREGGWMKSAWVERSAVEGRLRGKGGCKRRGTRVLTVISIFRGGIPESCLKLSN